MAYFQASKQKNAVTVLGRITDWKSAAKEIRGRLIAESADIGAEMRGSGVGGWGKGRIFVLLGFDRFLVCTLRNDNPNNN